MPVTVKRPLASLGMLLVILASAPGDPKQASPAATLDPEKASQLETLARKRLASARKAYDYAWTQYRQSETGSSVGVYFWSYKVMDAQMTLADGEADRVAALQEHRDRMAKIQSLAHKVQRLGFSRRIDTEESTYYVIEADFNLAVEKAR